MKHQGLTALLGLGLILGGALYGDEDSDSGTGSMSRTVRVDCAKGDSINRALRTRAAELTIEIEGICHEDVVVERSQVTLIGTDPALDGIRGVDPDPTKLTNAVVRVVDADDVRFESLSISDGVRIGVQVASHSLRVEIVGSVVENHGRDGIQALDNSLVLVTDSAIRNNGRSGFAGFDSELLSCSGCTIEGARFGVLLIGGTRFDGADSTIAGDNFGLIADNGGSTGSCLRCDLSGAAASIAASDMGSIWLQAGTLDGPILGELQSHVRLEGGVQQNANAAGFNRLDGGSVCVVLDASLLGDTFVSNFANVSLRAPSALDGGLFCDSGGNSYCDDPGAITGSASCGQCSAP